MPTTKARLTSQSSPGSMQTSNSKSLTHMVISDHVSSTSNHKTSRRPEITYSCLPWGAETCLYPVESKLRMDSCTFWCSCFKCWRTTCKIRTALVLLCAWSPSTSRIKFQMSFFWRPQSIRGSICFTDFTPNSLSRSPMTNKMSIFTSSWQH